MTRLTRIAITVTIFFGILLSILLSQGKMAFSQWVTGPNYPSPALSPIPLGTPASSLGLPSLLAPPLAEPFGYPGLPSLGLPSLGLPSLGLPSVGLAGYGQTWPASTSLFPNPVAGQANLPPQGPYPGISPNPYQIPYLNRVSPVVSPLQTNQPLVPITNTAYSQGVVSPYPLYSNQLYSNPLYNNPLYSNPSMPLYSNPSVPLYSNPSAPLYNNPSVLLYSSNPSVPAISGYNPYSGYLASQGTLIPGYSYSSYPAQGTPSYSSYPYSSYPYSSYPYSSVPSSSALYPGLYGSASGFYTPPSNTDQQQTGQDGNSNGNSNDNSTGNSNDNSQTSDSTSSQTTSPAQVTGVWIGTWTASFASQQGKSASAASITLTQADTSVSGAFLFVGHSTINGISANGVVQGNNLQMTASKGENESALTITFKGDVKGDTLSGEYLIVNKAGAALEVGQFVVSRVM